MADPAQFDHDRLGHLLSDRLLRVPRFQRSYAWEAEHIEEFLADLETARESKSKYFVGTIVLAADETDTNRQIIVDGQQRLTTAAILLTAVRDRLRQLGKTQPAESVDTRFLRRFDLQAEDTLTRLTLNPNNLESHEFLLSEDRSELDDSDPIAVCYDICLSHVRGIATNTSHRPLIDLVTQLEDDVQVLLAVAGSISEAYVIFETLNDRGADLTTADLLKNYLFSKAGDYLDYVERRWVEMVASILPEPSSSSMTSRSGLGSDWACACGGAGIAADSTTRAASMREKPAFPRTVRTCRFPIAAAPMTPKDHSSQGPPRAKSIGTITRTCQTPAHAPRRNRTAFVHAATVPNTKKVALALLLAIATAGCGGLPQPPEPAAGEVTGVVGTSGFFRAQASNGYTVIAALPGDRMDEYWALGKGDPDEVPEDGPVIATMPREREALEQIEGVILAEVENSLFTLRGLDPNKDYWFCAGETDDEDAPVRVGFRVCDQPDVDIPGSITAWSGGQSPGITTHDSP